MLKLSESNSTQDSMIILTKKIVSSYPVHWTNNRKADKKQFFSFQEIYREVTLLIPFRINKKEWRIIENKINNSNIPS